MQKKWGIAELALVIWAGLALAPLILTTFWFQGAFPIFTVVCLGVPLLVVIRTSDAQRVGIRPISWQTFLITTGINLSGLLLLSLTVEPWSHAYQALVKEVLVSIPPDTTFVLLVRFKGLMAWGGLFLFSGLVTIFGEELFFRGWLLQSLQRRMHKACAILIQAALFTIPQLLAAFMLTLEQGVIYSLVYSLLGVGVIGGWAAARTQSIWPSLASATLWNLILVAWIL